MGNFTASSIFLLSAAGFLLAVSGGLVYALFSAKHRGRIIGFLLEGTTEANGKPSISRLQMMIWNIVVAFGFLYVLANVSSTGYGDAKDGGASTLSQALDALLSTPILILLGVSNATYLMGKVTPQAGASADSAPTPETIQKAVEKIPTDAIPPIPPTPAPPAPMG